MAITGSKGLKINKEATD